MNMKTMHGSTRARSTAAPIARAGLNRIRFYVRNLMRERTSKVTTPPNPRRTHVIAANMPWYRQNKRSGILVLPTEG